MMIERKTPERERLLEEKKEIREYMKRVSEYAGVFEFFGCALVSGFKIVSIDERLDCIENGNDKKTQS